jgi:hypothetical protein
VATLPGEKFWGIGPHTTAQLAKPRIRTTREDARASEAWVRRVLTNPFDEIGQELTGERVREWTTTEKASYL